MASVYLEKRVVFTNKKAQRLEVNQENFQIHSTEKPFTDDGVLKNGALVALTSAVREFMSSMLSGHGCHSLRV
jgi:hypothetical protein